MRQHLVVTMTVAVTIFSSSTLWAAQQFPTSGHSLGSVTGGHFGKAQAVIQKRCISCHSEKVIEDAIASGKNMQQIQQRMEQKGVRLSANDRTVLGVFWQQTPLKKK